MTQGPFVVKVLYAHYRGPTGLENERENKLFENQTTTMRVLELVHSFSRCVHNKLPKNCQEIKDNL